MLTVVAVSMALTFVVQGFVSIWLMIAVHWWIYHASEFHLESGSVFASESKSTTTLPEKKLSCLLCALYNSHSTYHTTNCYHRIINQYMSYWQIKDTVTNMQSIVRKRLLLESEVDRKVSFQFTYRQPDFVFNFFMPFTYPQIIYCYMIAKKKKKEKTRRIAFATLRFIYDLPSIFPCFLINLAFLA